MQTFNLSGKHREQIGKVAARTARSVDMIPCILYGDGENINFEVTKVSVKNLVYSPNVYKVILNIDGTSYDTLMREIQFHVVTDEIQHIDFLKLVPGKKVTCSVPIRLEGTSMGVKEGGKLVQRVRKAAIKALPKDLVDKVVIDVTSLDINNTVRLGDIKIENVAGR